LPIAQVTQPGSRHDQRQRQERAPSAGDDPRKTERGRPVGIPQADLRYTLGCRTICRSRDPGSLGYATWFFESKWQHVPPKVLEFHELQRDVLNAVPRPGPVVLPSSTKDRGA